MVHYQKGSSRNSPFTSRNTEKRRREKIDTKERTPTSHLYQTCGWITSLCRKQVLMVIIYWNYYYHFLCYHHRRLLFILLLLAAGYDDDNDDSAIIMSLYLQVCVLCSYNSLSVSYIIQLSLSHFLQYFSFPFSCCFSFSLLFFLFHLFSHSSSHLLLPSFLSLVMFVCNGVI